MKNTKNVSVSYSWKGQLINLTAEATRLLTAVFDSLSDLGETIAQVTMVYGQTVAVTTIEGGALVQRFVPLSIRAKRK